MLAAQAALPAPAVGKYTGTTFFVVTTRVAIFPEFWQHDGTIPKEPAWTPT